MATNQKYSQRIHSKRQFVLANAKLDAASLILSEIGSRYQDALPAVSEACASMVEMINMLRAMVEDIRSNV